MVKMMKTFSTILEKGMSEKEDNSEAIQKAKDAQYLSQFVNRKYIVFTNNYLSEAFLMNFRSVEDENEKEIIYIIKLKSLATGHEFTGDDIKFSVHHNVLPMLSFQINNTGSLNKFNLAFGANGVITGTFKFHDDDKNINVVSGTLALERDE